MITIATNRVTRLLCLVITLSLLSFQLSAQNIAQGKPTTASSTQDASLPASNATDGNATTRWGSAYADPQWIQVDLGASYAVNRVVLRWEAAYGTAYQIQISSNGTSWSNIYTTTTGNGATDDLTGLSGSGRYIRMNGTARATIYGYSLFEIEVYGTPQTNIAIGKTATASSVQDAGFPASLAVDGNGTTRWSSAYSNPQWIQIDLGSNHNINRVVLRWEAAYGTAYQVQVSANGSTWNNIFSTTAGNGATDDLTGLSGSGRYIRMNGTARATAYGFSLFEFEVYGSPAGGGGGGGFDLSPYTLYRDYNFGTGAGNNVSNTTQLAVNFNPYAIAGTTVINNEWQRYQNFNSTNHAFTTNDLALTAVANLGGIFNGGISSGQIASKETFYPRNGRTWVLQVRAKVPNKVAAWPAFWMYAKQAPNTPSEIDIFEFFHSPTQNSYDWTGYDHGTGVGSNYHNIMTNQWVWHPGFDFAADYHTYTLVWKEGDIQKWVDGTWVKGTNFTWNGSDPQAIINLAIGGSNNNNPNSSTFPCQFLVDYFRVYYRDGGSALRTTNTAQEEVQLANNLIYPNPAMTEVKLAGLDKFVSGNVSIYDASGKRLVLQRINSAFETVNVAKLPAGTYIVRVERDAAVMNRKLVIQK
jgi:hypothetical protein